MTPRAVARLAAPLLALVAATMLAPIALAIWDGDLLSAFAYAASTAGCALRWCGAWMAPGPRSPPTASP